MRAWIICFLFQFATRKGRRTPGSNPRQAGGKGREVSTRGGCQKIKERRDKHQPRWAKGSQAGVCPALKKGFERIGFQKPQKPCYVRNSFKRNGNI